jgi:hypothetical protein
VDNNGDKVLRGYEKVERKGGEREGESEGGGEPQERAVSGLPVVVIEVEAAAHDAARHLQQRQSGRGLRGEKLNGRGEVSKTKKINIRGIEEFGKQKQMHNTSGTCASATASSPAAEAAVAMDHAKAAGGE